MMELPLTGFCTLSVNTILPETTDIYCTMSVNIKPSLNIYIQSDYFEMLFIPEDGLDFSLVQQAFNRTDSHFSFTEFLSSTVYMAELLSKPFLSCSDH